MNPQERFLEALHAASAAMQASGQGLSEEEIRGFFDGLSLSADQEQMVYEYLLHPPVEVKAPIETDAPEDSGAEEPDYAGEDMPAEEADLPDALKEFRTLSSSAHFQDYLTSVAAAETVEREQLLELYGRVGEEDPVTMQILTNSWLIRVLELARDTVVPGVHIEDVIQEGNTQLWMELLDLSEGISAEEIDAEIEEGVRRAMQAYVRQTVSEKETDEAAVGKAALIREAQKVLAEENGEMPTAEQLAEYTHISADEIRDILALVKELPELSKNS